MDTFDVNEYSEKSREVLRKVVEEIREQFLVGGSLRQFWFYTTRISDKTLTESIVQKWLEVLARNGLLHFYRLEQTELEQAIAFSQRYLEKGYDWDSRLVTQFIFGFPPHLSPSFAIDIYNTNLDELISLLEKKKLWSNFYKDEMGEFYYGNTLLVGINKSSLHREIVGRFLQADGRVISAKELTGIVSNDGDDSDYSNTARRNRIISNIRKELRSVSHDIDIQSHKSGHSVDYYELTIKKQSI